MTESNPAGRLAQWFCSILGFKLIETILHYKHYFSNISTQYVLLKPRFKSASEFINSTLLGFCSLKITLEVQAPAFLIYEDYIIPAAFLV